MQVFSAGRNDRDGQRTMGTAKTPTELFFKLCDGAVIASHYVSIYVNKLLYLFNIK